MIDRRYLVLLPLSLLFLATACTNKGTIAGGTSATPPPTTTPPPGPAQPPQTGSYILLSSDTGDFIGAGESYVYTKADSLITVTAQGGLLTLDIQGDESWTGEFQLPDTFTELEAGTYSNLTRYPFHDPVVGGLNWSGEGRGCNMLDAAMTINDVVYDAGALASIDLEFEQYCEGNSPALRGQVSWDASDTTSPPGPTTPPDNLWQPTPGATPGSGNYVYLTSEPGDFVGAGMEYLYTDADATIEGLWVVQTENVGIIISPVDFWNGDFKGPISQSFLEPGYYADVQRYPFNNPVKGGMAWFGQGRGCNTLTGWFVVDNISFNGDVLTAIDIRFEQHCEGGDPALRGVVHWAQ